jgi:hypothetical protein
MTTPDKITAVMALPSADSLATEAQQTTATVVGITISSDTGLQLVIDDLKAIKTRRDALEARRMTITRPLDQAKQAVMDLFRRPLEAMDMAISAGKQACVAYTRERDRRLAQEQAEREHAAKAERDRLVAEARALMTKAAEAPSIIAQAQLEQEAVDLQTRAITTVAPIMPAAAKAVGAHGRKSWTVDVTDPKAVVLAIIQHHPAMFDKCVGLQLPGLRAWANLVDGKLDLPGMTVSERDSLVLR